MKRLVVWGVVALGGFLGCSGDDDGSDPGPNCPTGDVGCDCYGNDSCNDSLVCEMGTCVLETGAGGSDTSAGGSDASAGAPPLGTAGDGSSNGGAGGSHSGGSGGASLGGGAGENPGGAGGGPADLVDVELDCGSRDVSGATPVSGAISASTTWSGVIHVTDDVSVRNEAVITIEPGTKIIVGLGAEIEFGWENSAPTLIAAGTVEEPILICGEVKEAGYWSRLVLRENVKPASLLRNVLIEGAGKLGSGGALVLDAAIAVQGVQVRLSEEPGVTAADFGLDSRRLSVATVEGNPVRLTDSRAVSHFPVESTLDANGYPFAEIAFASIDESTVFHRLDVPYYQGSGVVAGGADVTVTFEPGVDYRIAGPHHLDLKAVEVHAVGDDEPVLFQGPCVGRQGCDEEAGTLTLGGLGETKLDHVEIVGLGSEAPGLETVEGSPVSFKDVSVSEFAHPVGFRASAPFTSDSEGLAVNSDVQGEALELAHWDALRTLPIDTAASSAGNQGPVGTTFKFMWTSGTIKKFAFGVNYIGFLAYGSDVVIDPGSELRILSQEMVTVEAEGSLTALGSAEEPITFTTIPSGGKWGGLFVYPGSEATLDHVVINGGGSTYPPYANVHAYTPISITNSVISGSAGWGLVRKAEDTTDYATGNTFQSNVSGNIGTLE